MFKLSVLVICFTVSPGVNGCGQIPVGRERTIKFTVTDFKLPAIMAYSGNPADKVRAPTISTTSNEAESFVQRMVMESVTDVLYQQGRSSFLPDNVIATILQQLEIKISYEPLMCDNVIIDLVNGMAMNAMKINCIIVDDTVTSTCSNANNAMCMGLVMIGMNSKRVDPKHLTISGSLKTNNVIMANWSNQMWQNVLNKVLRKITTSPNGSFFYGASITLN